MHTESFLPKGSIHLPTKPLKKKLALKKNTNVNWLRTAANTLSSFWLKKEFPLRKLNIGTPNTVSSGALVWRGMLTRYWVANQSMRLIRKMFSQCLSQYGLKNLRPHHGCGRELSMLMALSGLS